MYINALLIPADKTQPIQRIAIADDRLDALQGAVGGMVESVPYHADPTIVAYINELGKLECEPNPRATQLLGPGLFAGDFIAGDVVICGLNQRTGGNADCPDGFEARLSETRVLPQPDTTIHRKQHVSSEWALTAAADGRFSVAVLLVQYESAGVDLASGETHGSRFSATLTNKAQPADADHLTSADASLPISRLEVSGFSRLILELFAALALKHLCELYAKSDPRVTRYFAVASGAAL
jgi:hypothetical protein